MKTAESQATLNSIVGEDSGESPAESRTQQSGEETEQSEDVPDSCPSGATWIDFEQLRDEGTEIWNRSLDADYDIEQRGRPDLFVVGGDGDVPENCSLAGADHQGYVGWCSCPEFGQDGCIHLCVVRQKVAIGGLSLPPIQG
jgi:hypothetical protein